MRALVFLLILGVGSASAFDLLDPSSLVEELSQHSAGLERWKRPGFCGKMDCPPFRTKKRTDNWDLRKYDAGKWVVTNITQTQFELAYTQGVAKLLKYFKGGNDKEETIEVTTPTLAELKLENGEAASKDYSFSLWLPEEFQKHTPQPTDKDVKIVEYDSMTVYVRIFGGFATEGTILKETKSLQNMLDDDECDFSADVVWAAVYDPPQKLLRRHNEIHIPYSAKKI